MRDINRLEKRIEGLEFYTSLSLLERDIAEVRKEYKIGVPVVYKQFVKKFGKQGESRMDTFHPQYADLAWEIVDERI